MAAARALALGLLTVAASLVSCASAGRASPAPHSPLTPGCWLVGADEVSSPSTPPSRVLARPGLARRDCALSVWTRHRHQRRVPCQCRRDPLPRGTVWASWARREAGLLGGNSPISPSATPGFTDLWAVRRSTPPSLVSPPPRTERAIGWWEATAAYSLSAMPLLRLHGWPRTEPTCDRHGGKSGRIRVLVGGCGWRHLCVWRCALRGVNERDTAQRADCGYGGCTELSLRRLGVGRCPT